MPQLQVNRFSQLADWVHQQPGLNAAEISIASADASFRQYYRVQQGKQTFIVMDAPPEQEDVHPFITVTQLLQNRQVRVPAIHAKNMDHGFLLLDDLGNQNLLDQITPTNADMLYRQALDTLIKIQQADCSKLPPYNRDLLYAEMALFEEWFLNQYLQITLTAAQQNQLNQVFSKLIESAQNQPQVFVHRDYHSRNLMIVDEGEPAVIDHQDAVQGPLTYDLVSLLRDCYIDWPNDRVNQWVLEFKQRLSFDGNSAPGDDTFLRWFDLMGLQRHIKVLGIFSRLFIRDGKAGYLKDLPRTLQYVITAAERHDDTRFLATLAQDLELQHRCFQPD